MLKNKALAAAPSATPLYVEDVFSTYLYTGNGSTQTITNGIDLAGKGGMVWIKGRNAAYDHYVNDTERGAGNTLITNSTTASVSFPTRFTAFTSTGFSIGGGSNPNDSSGTFASWTFRKAPKFFDVVTYTGNGVNGRQVAHNLGSVPGMIIVKVTSETNDWYIWHRTFGTNQYIYLNSILEKQTFAGVFGTPTSTYFVLGNDVSTNGSGATYVAYLFAHDAGGFGEAGDQSVVSCGSYTGNGSATGPVVTLGYEPQYLMIKNASGTGNWQIIDNMRGMPVGTADATLRANLANAESAVEYVSPTATGFQITSTSAEVNTNTSTYIYLAIRRGPMKKPTSGTQVFNTRTAGQVSPTPPLYTAGFPVDFAFDRQTTATDSWIVSDRLRGANRLVFNTTAAEGPDTTKVFSYQNGYYNVSATDTSYRSWMFRRAPGFFDVVCYRGNGSTQNVSHNLTVAPNLIIVKNRGTAGTDWYVYSSAFPAVSGNPPENLYLFLNGTGGLSTTGAWNYTAPTASVFSVAGGNNESANNYVAYLFATLPGVSKVGSYTGTGTTQQINCGFTTGARFVLIRRTDFGTNNWFVWDTARGISTSNDPYLLLNSTAAEVTNTDYIDPLASGFEISSTAPAEINANGGNFVFFAVA